MTTEFTGYKIKKKTAYIVTQRFILQLFGLFADYSHEFSNFSE
jgi:hypothetical protein